MKRYWLAAGCFFLIMALLAGCNLEASPTDTQETTVSEELEPIPAVLETTAPLGFTLTKADILDLFYGYAYADPTNRKAIDCVVVTDLAYDLIGVVMYSTEDQKGCSFDFLQKDGICVGQIGIGSTPTENTELEYLGDGVFSCHMLHTDGSSYLCKIYYTFDEANGTDFRIEAL